MTYVRIRERSPEAGEQEAMHRDQELRMGMTSGAAERIVQGISKT